MPPQISLAQQQVVLLKENYAIMHTMCDMLAELLAHKKGVDSLEEHDAMEKSLDVYREIATRFLDDGE